MYNHQGLTIKRQGMQTYCDGNLSFSEEQSQGDPGKNKEIRRNMRKRVVASGPSPNDEKSQSLAVQEGVRV